MKPSYRSIFALLISGLIAAGITIYQWLALLALRTSNEKPLCAINEALDCSAIWDSPLSTSIHQLSGIPLAGWGLVWSLLIIVFSIKLLLDKKNDRDNSLAVAALFACATLGAIGVVALILYSLSLQVFCLSCITFYIVVVVITFVVLTQLLYNKKNILAGGGAALALAITLALALYIPGQNTPLTSVLSSPLVATEKSNNNNQSLSNAPVTANEELKDFIEAQPQEVLQAISNFLAEYREAKTIKHDADSNRLMFGSAQSPVNVVEWLEITCPHCAQLSQQLASIKNSTDTEAWSLATRYYPLDSECNPNMSRSRSDGVSCLAAKSLICLSDNKDKVHAIQETFFANQKQLTTNMIRDIIRDHEVDMVALTACIESETTANTLAIDIAMAQDHGISGTPLVVMNGRSLTAMPHLIYGLILSGGDDAAAEFSRLPTPEPISHDGHDH